MSLTTMTLVFLAIQHGDMYTALYYGSGNPRAHTVLWLGDCPIRVNGRNLNICSVVKTYLGLTIFAQEMDEGGTNKVRDVWFIAQV